MDNTPKKDFWILPTIGRIGALKIVPVRRRHLLNSHLESFISKQIRNDAYIQTDG